MKIIVEKKAASINFIDKNTGKKFNYLDFADDLYAGNKLEISKYDGVNEDERKVIDSTVKELNDLADHKKRKKIILQLDSANDN